MANPAISLKRISHTHPCGVKTNSGIQTLYESLIALAQGTPGTAVTAVFQTDEGPVQIQMSVTELVGTLSTVTMNFTSPRTKKGHI